MHEQERSRLGESPPEGKQIEILPESLERGFPQFDNFRPNETGPKRGSHPLNERYLTGLGGSHVLLLYSVGVGKSSLVHLICHKEVLSNPAWTVGCTAEVKVRMHGVYQAPL